MLPGLAAMPIGRGPDAPVINSISPNTGAAVVIAASGTSVPNADISLYRGGVLAGTTTANGAGTWTVSGVILAVGANSLTAVATLNSRPSVPSGAFSAPLSLGLQSFATPGTYPITVPVYASVAADVGGASGGGGGSARYAEQDGGTGGDGGDSSFGGILAHGGKGGTGATNLAAGTNGADGTATGGTTNTTGGGASPGGTGDTYGGRKGGDGGRGGRGQKTFAPGDLTPGAVLNVIVGVKGAPGSPSYSAPPGAGVDGSVALNWS